MPRPKNKADLIQAANENFNKLWQVIDGLSEQALTNEFRFVADAKHPNRYKEAHWQRDKNLRDVLAHLYEWHQLLLHWVTQNQAGNAAPFLPAPYTWKTYGQMNVALWEKHQNTPNDTAAEWLKTSHAAVMALIETFSDEELFTKKYFAWTGTTSLGSYCISATASHYDWAIKKLKAHQKSFPPAGKGCI